MSALINRLPDDILEEIFIHCLPESTSFVSSSAPLLLLQVCSPWRHLALKTSALWTKICLNDKNLHRKGLMSLLKMWFKYSGGQVIDVYIDTIWRDMTNRSEYSRKETYQSLVAALHTHCQRIRTLEGVFPTTIVGDLYIEELKSLEVLHLEGIPNSTGSLLVSNRIDLSTNLPRLTCFTCINFPLSTLSVCRQGQLRSLSLKPVSVKDACALLSALPNLEAVDFYIHQRGGSDTPTQRRLLPGLKVLRVHCDLDSRIDPGEIFSGFMAPNLEKLALEGLASIGSDFFWSSNDSWDALLSFVRASAPLRLRELSINYTGGINVFFLEMLHCIPNVRAIESHSGPINAQVLRALTWKETEDKQLAPKLEIIRFSDITRFRKEDVVPFLESRMHVLKDVALWDCSDMSEEIMSLGILVTEIHE